MVLLKWRLLVLERNGSDGFFFFSFLNDIFFLKAFFYIWHMKATLLDFIYSNYTVEIIFKVSFTWPVLKERKKREKKKKCWEFAKIVRKYRPFKIPLSLITLIFLGLEREIQRDDMTMNNYLFIHCTNSTCLLR